MAESPHTAESIQRASATLLALYPIGAPYTPGFRIADHLSPLTLVPEAEPPLLPSFHSQPEFAEGLSAISSRSGHGTPMQDVELEQQRRLNSLVSQMSRASGPAAPTYPIIPVPSPESSFSPITSALLQWNSQSLQPLAPASPLAAPTNYRSSESPAFLEDFIAQWTEAMVQRSQSQFTQPRSSSQASMMLSSSPTRSDETHHPHTPSTSRVIAPSGFPNSVASTGAMSDTSPSKTSPLKRKSSGVAQYTSHDQQPIKLKFRKPSSNGSATPPVDSSKEEEFDFEELLIEPQRTLMPMSLIKPVRKKEKTIKTQEMIDNENKSRSSNLKAAKKKHEGDYEIDYEMKSEVDDGNEYMHDVLPTATPPKRPDIASRKSSISTGRKTADREEQNAPSNLKELVEDIFEAEDSLPAPITEESLQLNRFFSRISSSDSNVAILSPFTIQRILRLLVSISRLPHATISNWDVDAYQRLLKILRRSLRDGLAMDIYGPVVEHAGPDESPKKGSKKVSSSANKKGAVKGKGGDNVEEMDVDLDQTLAGTSAAADEFDELATTALESVEATNCIFVLLSTKGFPGLQFPEELFSLCLDYVKDGLNQIVYPFIEAFGAPSGASLPIMLSALIRTNSTVNRLNTQRQLISQIFSALTTSMTSIQNAVERTDIQMSDDLVIKAAYMSLGPFFIVETSSGGKGGGLDASAALRVLRLASLGLVRSVFASNLDQRAWIIQEILSSLVKLPDLKKSQRQYRLRDGRSIHTVTALLLQLIQTCSHGIEAEVEQHRLRTQSQRIVQNKEEDEDESLDVWETKLYQSKLDSARKCAMSIAVYLIQASATGKATKVSNEAERRAVLDTLLADLNVIVYYPEWPGASVLLSMFTKIMTTSLSDTKSSSEETAAKTIALDHLGVIASRIREAALRKDVEENSFSRSLPEIINACDEVELRSLIAAQADIKEHLADSAVSDVSLQSAFQFSTVVWGQEIGEAIAQLKITLSGTIVQDTRAICESMLETLSALREGLWKPKGNENMFKNGMRTDLAQLDSLSQQIHAFRGFSRAFDAILVCIIAAMDATSVTFRTKALRALGHIITTDEAILIQPSVRNSIEERVRDSSPAVRDAAVELIGRYVLQQTTVTDQYYSIISDRVTDSGVAVRKRVIKMLKSIYPLTDSIDRKVDICTKLVFRIDDEEETVKDLAVKAVNDIWFGSNKDPLTQVAVLAGVSKVMRERQSPMEMFLRQIVQEKMEKCKDPSAFAEALAPYQSACNALVDSLIDSENTDNNTAHIIKAIYIMSLAYPAVISGPKAALLAPYMKSPRTADEQAVSGYLLRIFRSCIPKMPKTVSTFGKDLQKTLLAMVTKPSPTGGASALQESVACLCSVVHHLTGDYACLVNLLKGTTSKLQGVRASISRTGHAPENQKALPLLMYISALLAENCDFDSVRAEGKISAQSIEEVSKGSIPDFILSILLAYRKLPVDTSTQQASLTSMGFLSRAYPTTMLRPQYLEVMDGVFASDQLDNHSLLFGILLDFLVSQSVKQAAERDAKEQAVVIAPLQKEVNMSELIGDTDGFAESGVASTVVQRYLPQVLVAALHPQTQNAALEILTVTVKQGLAHPIQSLPIIIALETSSELPISGRAFTLHNILQNKHASIINSRYLESTRAAYEFQVQSCADLVRGYRVTEGVPEALLKYWYSLIREKRPLRRDFLRALIRVFDIDISPRSSFTAEDVAFSRFLSDNLSAFQYKTNEEVFIILERLNSILSVAAIQLYEVLSTANLREDLAAVTEGQSLEYVTVTSGSKKKMSQIVREAGERDGSFELVMNMSNTETIEEVHVSETNSSPSGNTFNLLSLLNASTILSMVFSLKHHLKTFYGISEDSIKKFVPGKKSTLSEKPAIRNEKSSISPVIIYESNNPFVFGTLQTAEDYIAKAGAFMQLVEQDGGLEPDMEES